MSSPEPTLFDRIARVAHEATRAWIAPADPDWEALPEQRRFRTVETVKAALAGERPEKLHVRIADARELLSSPGYVNDSSDEQRLTDLIAAIAQTLGCGKERWDVKTLTDPAAGQVNLTPVPATVAELVALPAPVQPTARVSTESSVAEFTTYQLQGTITLAKLEADSDVHMILDDGQGHTMICEAVCPGCASASPVLPQIQAVRSAVEAQFPTAAAGAGVERGLSVQVTVTGVAFFDRLHGQDGVAPNGIELHPLLSFEVHP